ncbi:hypothetical protein ABVT39_006958 [Epinephelus coioides]
MACLERLALQNREPAIKKRVLRDRIHPLDVYDDFDIYCRYRFRRAQIMRITDMLTPAIEHGSESNGALPPSLQVTIALQYFATGSMQNVVGDTIQVHKSTVCQAVRRVALALCGHLNDYVSVMFIVLIYTGLAAIVVLTTCATNITEQPKVNGCFPLLP